MQTALPAHLECRVSAQLVSLGISCADDEVRCINGIRWLSDRSITQVLATIRHTDTRRIHIVPVCTDSLGPAGYTIRRTAAQKYTPQNECCHNNDETLDTNHNFSP